MADQENPETPEEQAPEAVEVPVAPDPAAAVPEAEAPAEAPAADAPDAEAPAETPAADEPVAEEAPADEAPADDEPAAAAAPAAEPAPAQLTPKERKAAARVRRGLRRGATPEERAEQRAQKAAARRRRRQQEKAKRATKGEGTPPAEHGPGAPKVRLGTVVSNKADKTITVRVDVARRHRRYQKIVRSSSTLHAHDERNDANEGDLVRVVESRPMSRTKRWRLVDILERAK